MGDEAFQKSVLDGFKEARRDSVTIRRDIGKVQTAVELVKKDTEALSGRVGHLEQWHDDCEDKAEATGQHELISLREQLDALKAEKADRRKQWFNLGVKVLVLVVGAGLAVLMPAIAKAFGIG